MDCEPDRLCSSRTSANRSIFSHFARALWSYRQAEFPPNMAVSTGPSAGPRGLNPNLFCIPMVTVVQSIACIKVIKCNLNATPDADCRDFHRTLGGFYSPDEICAGRNQPAPRLEDFIGMWSGLTHEEVNASLGRAANGRADYAKRWRLAVYGPHQLGILGDVSPSMTGPLS